MKSFCCQTEKVLAVLISSHQIAEVTNRCIRKPGRLVSDQLEVTEKLNINSYLVTVDMEKSFDY